MIGAYPDQTLDPSPAPAPQKRAGIRRAALKQKPGKRKNHPHWTCASVSDPSAARGFAFVQSDGSGRTPDEHR